jgi:HEAT repeat protein
VRIGGPGVSAGARYLLETASRDRERNWTDAYHIFMAPTAREALPALLDAVRDPTVRDCASETARELSPYLNRTKDPLADVKSFLSDRDAGVRCVAAWFLYEARAVDIKDAVAAQRELLKAPDPWVRRRAARNLSRLGPGGKDAVEALTALLQDKDAGVREAAARALESIQPKK